jgi:beta-glucosidase
VQLYFRDKVGSLVRPVKQLAGFQQVLLKKAESRTLTFTITEKDFRFFNDKLEFRSEPGEFELFAGNCSAIEKGVSIWLK